MPGTVSRYPPQTVADGGSLDALSRQRKLNVLVHISPEYGIEMLQKKKVASPGRCRLRRGAAVVLLAAQMQTWRRAECVLWQGKLPPGRGAGIRGGRGGTDGRARRSHHQPSDPCPPAPTAIPSHHGSPCRGARTDQRATHHARQRPSLLYGQKAARLACAGAEQSRAEDTTAAYRRCPAPSVVH